MDEFYMSLALEDAMWAIDENEVPVGCVIVKDDDVIARAHNKKEQEKLATRHAEILAIEEASKKVGNWRLEGCTLYVTLEPCMMCLGAILEARIGEVVYGASDPRVGACGGFFNAADMPGYPARVNVRSGVMEKDCADVIENFFKTARDA